MGLLAFHDHRLERTHDVVRLVSLGVNYEPELANWQDAAITLTPYATAYRYPGESSLLEPDRVEFDEALRAAEQLCHFVFSSLPTDVQPD
jgi:hypothetical protein